jgi:xanthine dehydrogenase YagS FAD-binding subunit
VTVHFPPDWTTAASLAPGATVRAGGTDVTEVRRLGVSRGDVVDLRDLLRRPEARSVETLPEGGLRVPALLSVETLGNHPAVRAAWPGLAMAAATLATPQIRRVGTVGGNLLQAVRCWYFRSPEFHCLRKGGGTCHARDGEHENHAIFDRSACVAVHPSTLAMALLTTGARIRTDRRELVIAELLGDGGDPRHTHRLAEGELLQDLVLPAPPGPMRGACQRATGRVRAEWPIVECAVHLDFAGDRIRSARVAVGAVAAVPFRLPKVEAALETGATSPETLRDASLLAAEGARPLRDNAAKVQVLCGIVRSTLHEAMGWP